jgi:hypothetical protein
MPGRNSTLRSVEANTSYLGGQGFSSHVRLFSLFVYILLSLLYLEYFIVSPPVVFLLAPTGYVFRVLLFIVHSLTQLVVKLIGVLGD